MNSRQRIAGLLLYLTQDDDLTTTYVHVLPIIINDQQDRGPIKINVDIIDKIKLDIELQAHFDSASKEVQQEIIYCLEGRIKTEEDRKKK